ncbi:HAMP domain-containing sensor histidine kinase [Pontiellaceae bacterium B1224]|nr:HAMP domain-containing sensor histidine kinase [Pontiellaceae bacterium B1224]
MNYSAVSLDKFIPRTRSAFGFGILIALLVLGLTVSSGLLFVRNLVREQIVRRDAVALHATMLMEQIDIEEMDELDIRTDEQISFDAAVRSSRLRDVLGIRFYDTAGTFYDSFPATIQPQPLDAAALESLHRFQPVGKFLPEEPLDSVFIYLPEFSNGPAAKSAMLEVTVPLHQRNTKKLLGAAQFIIEGQSVASEYAQLDRNLLRYALTTFLIAGLLMVAMLWPAFRRVQKLTTELAYRSERLQQANEELALAARVSAVGAVSAHLMHGLKNPLASLSQFVSAQKSEGGESRDWEDALTAAHRMQSLVEQTMETLSDAKGQPSYELTVPELGEELIRRVQDRADLKQIPVQFTAEGKCMLSSRTANLASLILVNLLENAIQVTPAGKTVQVRASRDPAFLYFRVSDEGPGFPEDQLNELFLPGKSTREGGSGLGLAISKQIAEFLEADLQLEKSGADGCTFMLKLPMSVCLESPC